LVVAIETSLSIKEDLREVFEHQSKRGVLQQSIDCLLLGWIDDMISHHHIGDREGPPKTTWKVGKGHTQ
jgi:hypothetical protein